MVDGSRHAVGSRIKRRSVLGVTFRHLAAQKTKPEYYAGFLQADPTHHVFPSVRIANALFSSRNDFVQFFTGVVMPGCGRRIGDFSTFLFHNVSQLDVKTFLSPFPGLGRFAIGNPRFHRGLLSAAAPQL